MPRLLLHGQVLFAAAHNPQGKAALVISLGQAGLFHVVSSADACEEARRNLARKFPQALQRLESIIATLAIVSDAALIPCPDALPDKDRPIDRAAHACRADGGSGGGATGAPGLMELDLALRGWLELP